MVSNALLSSLRRRALEYSFWAPRGASRDTLVRYVKQLSDDVELLADEIQRLKGKDH